MTKKTKQIIPHNGFTEFLLYTTPNGKVKVEIFLRDENIWLTQDKIALLFGVQRPAITKQFFATVQNKLHFAVTGKTAAEIVHERKEGRGNFQQKIIRGLV